MTLEVQLFGPIREAFDAPRFAVTVPEPATAGDIVSALAAERPEQAELLSRCRVAVDRSLVGAGTRISAGTEVAIIPPVSGG